jgi:hypothetical protein
MVTVPNLQGLTQAAATAAIARAKLAMGTVTATGKIVSQDPPSGSSVAQGSQVNLVISLGPQMVTVPNVEGLTQAAATAAVTATNLTVALGPDAGGSVPVIAMSAFFSQTARARTHYADFRAFLPKPFTPDKLLETILGVL